MIDTSDPSNHAKVLGMQSQSQIQKDSVSDNLTLWLMSFSNQMTHTMFLYNKGISNKYHTTVSRTSQLTQKLNYKDNEIEFKFSEGDEETWPTPWDATLNPLAAVTRWGIFG